MSRSSSANPGQSPLSIECAVTPRRAGFQRRRLVAALLPAKHQTPTPTSTAPNAAAV